MSLTFFVDILLILWMNKSKQGKTLHKQTLTQQRSKTHQNQQQHGKPALKTRSANDLRSSRSHTDGKAFKSRPGRGKCPVRVLALAPLDYKDKNNSFFINVTNNDQTKRDVRNVIEHSLVFLLFVFAIAL